MRVRALVVAVLLVPASPAGAELTLPPGFSAEVYVTGTGFDPAASRAARGLPSTSTLAVDHAGAVLLARTGRRYLGDEVDMLRLYRIPPGGARLAPGGEARYAWGPPLWNPQVSAGRAGRELFVTTFERDRLIGAVYRLHAGRAELFAGGTPPRGGTPLLVQPEGVAVDRSGRVYVADRQRGVVVRFDPSGRVLDARWASMTRPRVLAMDDADRLWVGSDGSADAPWQRTDGEIWRVGADGEARRVLRGPMPAGIALSPGGRLFVADRHAERILAVDAEGRAVEFARFTDGDAPRSLGFVPVTPDTRRAGIAGDLLVVTIRRGAWPVNEVVRISGPFDAPHE
ncbi:MAG: hypothetical protein A3I14_00225 [Candidatus Rokubacteria bacterium RIFCSPLOWO2_02_FULL_73_56]|nr:MAG: hypothetical protein A3D33_08690 [Candidatus Rokubacteria bacterium RIFCSPHIGHO2_02_FULL_73_26]OGL13296.1 MAG: hypothetical protein A3I14_00225 [Candidatus Rokubacteria bacterium RIFCSPLOWO2_02_FULL_73_56]OGL21349.1 MAG: hypothetical protein A3G44_05315 [Candidatus Rokubacteria bacterium RIFCSPLOWO2_12_FULL_73_47]